MLNHATDHLRPAQSGAIGQGQRQLVGIAFDGNEFQAATLDELREWPRRGQANDVAGAAQPEAQGDEWLDIAARSVRQESEPSGSGCGGGRRHSTRPFTTHPGSAWIGCCERTRDSLASRPAAPCLRDGYAR